MPQRADPAQHGRDQLAHQRAVAIGKRGKPGMRVGAVELGIERTPPPQHVVEDIGRDAAGRETGNFGGRYTSSRCHEFRLPGGAVPPNHFSHSNEAEA